MWLRIEPRSPTPIYQQVVDGIREAVAKGVVRSGDKLPSVRELAAEMTLNPNTVAKAYRELERERVITVVRGRGTYIASQGIVPDRQERLEQMMNAIRQLLVDAHHLQMSEDEFMKIVFDTVKEWRMAPGVEKRESGH